MDDTQNTTLGEMDSLFSQVKAMVMVALESAGNDGKIDPLEAVRLAAMGVGLVQAIIAMVQRNHGARLKDTLRSVVENSKVDLPA